MKDPTPGPRPGLEVSSQEGGEIFSDFSAAKGMWSLERVAKEELCGQGDQFVYLILNFVCLFTGRVDTQDLRFLPRKLNVTIGMWEQLVLFI